jgi:hypothetical protein
MTGNLNGEIKDQKIGAQFSMKTDPSKKTESRPAVLGRICRPDVRSRQNLPNCR